MSEIAGHVPLLEATCPSISRDLLAVRRCASWQSVPLFQPLEVTWGFALLVTLRSTFFSHSPRKNCDKSRARKKMQGSFLAWAGCHNANFKGHLCSLYWQHMRVVWGNDRYVDGWFLKLFYSTSPRSTDRPTHESLQKKLSDFRNSLHVQIRVEVRRRFWEAGFSLLSGATWFHRSRDRGFDQRRMIPNFGDPSGQRHVGGRRRDTHTADKVLTHGQTLLFYRYRVLHIKSLSHTQCFSYRTFFAYTYAS